MKFIKKFLKNNHADINMIGTVAGLLITIVIAILVFYNLAANLDASSLDSNIGDGDVNPAQNATNTTLAQAETVFQIMPIIAIVIVAVVILGYVGRIGG